MALSSAPHATTDDARLRAEPLVYAERTDVPPVPVGLFILLGALCSLALVIASVLFLASRMPR
jgi:hypothetical protein